ncbi:MAG: ATP-binding cassette domain-containing protein, partial [Gemmatimonadaceae bacterium]
MSANSLGIVMSATEGSGAALTISGLRVRRGDREILRGVDLSVARGEICALMGVSGSGKSTVLRSIAALLAFDGGTIRVGNESLVSGNLPPERHLRSLRRTVGMVFQAHALFEHLTVLQNVTLAPTHALGWSTHRADDVA